MHTINICRKPEKSIMPLSVNVQKSAILDNIHLENKKPVKMTSKSLYFVFLFSLFTSVDIVNCSEMCAPAFKELVHHSVATQDLFHHLPNNGSEVCRGGPCCMPSMTEKMLSRGRHLLHSTVQRETTALLEAVTGARDAFRNAIEAALYSSEQRTLDSFRVSYPRLVGHAKAPVRDLFAALHSSLSLADDSFMEKALNTFWDDLFPLVYHSTVHSRLPPFSHSYMECLRKSRKSIKPWKVVPGLIAESLSRGLDTARLMMRSLNTVSDVVLNVRQYEIPEECGHPAARLYFCSACHAAALVPPCSGFCLNVARGCLAPLAEVNSMWNSLGTAVSRIQESVKSSGLAQLLKELPERFSDAIMVAMESGTKLQKLVRNECGPYSHEQSKEWNDKTQEGLQDRTETTSLIETDTDSVGQTLIQRAEEAAAVLSGSHNFWRELADGTCSHLAAQITDCWDGDKITTYNRQVARVGVSAQKYNPEVQVLRPDTSVYALNDQMRTVKRLITKTLMWMPESDSHRQSDGNNLEGSGFDPTSEHYKNHDDEDAEDDGSGGYAGSGDSDNIAKFGGKPHSNPPLAGCSQLQSSFQLLGALFLLVMFRRPIYVI